MTPTKKWTVNAGTQTLDHVGDPQYQIPFAELGTSAELLDWIFQIEEKTWATDQDIRHLIHMFVHLAGREVCGGGTDHPVDVAERYKRLS